MDNDKLEKLKRLNCTEARNIISVMDGKILNLKGAMGEEETREKQQIVAADYVARQKKILSANYNNLNVAEKNQVLMSALSDAVCQMHSLINYGDESKHQSGTDFMKMIHVEHMVVKIQAKVRQILAIKRQERQIEEQKAQIRRKEQQRSGASNEELVLTELKVRLARKGMTPEAFFRTCDVEYTKSVAVSKFKAMLQNFKLELSRGQISRLCLILDEDQEGNISLAELQNALEAYGASGEKHVDPEGGDYYVPFDHRAMFKLMDILDKRQMSFEELYLMCDVDNDDDVNIKELEKVLVSMSDEFYTKDCQAIHNFLDIDNNNSCNKSEFMNQLERAKRLRQQDKDRREGMMTKAGDLRGRMTDTFNDREVYEPMDKYIEGFSNMSADNQYDRLTEYMSHQFSQRNIDPIRVHSMADTRRTGKPNFQQILHCLKKLLPQFEDEFLDQVPRVLQISSNDMLARDEWTNMFDVRQRQGFMSTSPQKSASQKAKDASKRADTADQDWTLLKYLAEQILQDKLDAKSWFKNIDKEHNNVMNVDQIKDAVKNWYPAAFDGLNYKKLERALDYQQKGYLEIGEFVRLMEQALSKGTSTSKVSEPTRRGREKGRGTDLRKQKPAAEDKPMTRDQFVYENDRISPKEALMLIDEMILTTDDVFGRNPRDAIETIFDKITKFKQSFADSEEWEDWISANISQFKRPGPAIKIHTLKTLWHHMTGIVDKESRKTLQVQLDLTQNEAAFICITSIDPEYFPWMLIEQSDFVKWFTTDFSGEGDDEKQEEEDFMNDKVADWDEATSLALELSAMGKSKDLDKIQNMEWWENQRFKNVGDGLLNKFQSDKKLYKNMEKLFQEHDWKLSYFDFFTYLEQDLQLQLLDWEEDALQTFLDSQGMAFIEFNEFNEFLRDFGYMTGKAVDEDDLEAEMERRAAISYKEYDVDPKNDYFMECPTMLRSEKAALATCRKLLKQSIKTKTSKWQDPDFGPKDERDLEGSAHSLYANGKIPSPGYVEPKDVEWMWSQDRCKPGQTLKFVDKGMSAADCIQGDLGDCWLISALSVAANRDELIVGGSKGIDPVEGMIVDNGFAQDCSAGIFPPIFHKFRAKGIYCLRFFKNFDWIYVIVDERIPVKKGTTTPCFGRCKDEDEMWVQLIEKAYAKLHGNYGNLISGYIDEGVQELTGMQPMKLLVRDETSGVFPHKQVLSLVEKDDKDRNTPDGALFFLMEDGVDDGCLLGCSIKGYGKVGQALIDGDKCGLIFDHAYAIQDVIYDENMRDKVTGEKLRLMRLRNPWGKTEWNGAWGEGSSELKTYREEINRYIKSLPKDEQFSLDDKDDGIFFMLYEDWRDNFSTVFMNIDFPEAWTGVRFKAAWTKSNSAGLPKTSDPKELQAYAKNPQFLLRPSKDTDLQFSMVQTGGRLPKKDPKTGEMTYYQYPFAETLHYANVTVFKLDYGEKTLDKFDIRKAVFVSPVKRERENGGKIKLLAKQTYIVCASAEQAGSLGEIWLSLYINQELRDVDITRVFPYGNDDNQAILPRYIKEESEKVFAVPAWKLDMVRESIPFMMTEDDAGANLELDTGRD